MNTKTQNYDAIIIGGGHNGLTAAAYLAKAGKRVLVLERRHLVGGAAVSEEIYPGFKYTVYSYVVSLLPPEIIGELERSPRKVYTGCVGRFDPDGDMFMNVAIRTVIMDSDGTCEMGIGSGIVADSDPAEEYEETVLKASFVSRFGREEDGEYGSSVACLLLGVARCHPAFPRHTPQVEVLGAGRGVGRDLLACAATQADDARVARRQHVTMPVCALCAVRRRRLLDGRHFVVEACRRARRRLARRYGVCGVFLRRIGFGAGCGRVLCHRGGGSLPSRPPLLRGPVLAMPARAPAGTDQRVGAACGAAAGAGGAIIGAP